MAETFSWLLLAIGYVGLIVAALSLRATLRLVGALHARSAVAGESERTAVSGADVLGISEALDAAVSDTSERGLVMLALLSGHCDDCYAAAETLTDLAQRGPVFAGFIDEPGRVGAQLSSAVTLLDRSTTTELAERLQVQRFPLVLAISAGGRLSDDSQPTLIPIVSTIEDETVKEH